MDWNGSLRTLVSQPDPSFGLLYPYHFDHQHPGMGMKHPVMAELGAEEKAGGGGEEKKKRMTKEQLEALECSFQEEVKLEPERKMRLSRELGLQPRQIAVWFQNRRARWKAKQLERLYDALKHEFDVVSMEKQKLQDEVVKLNAILRGQASNKKQVWRANTEVSGEDTVETSSIRCSHGNEPRGTAEHSQMLECNYRYTAIDGNYIPACSICWTATLPSYP